MVLSPGSNEGGNNQVWALSKHHGDKGVRNLEVRFSQSFSMAEVPREGILELWASFEVSEREALWEIPGTPSNWLHVKPQDQAGIQREVLQAPLIWRSPHRLFRDLDAVHN